MTDLAAVDYFTDATTAQDPYQYYEYLRGHGPVHKEPHHGVVAVTGYAEVMAAFKDVDSFSAVNAIGGPFPPLPFEPEGDDITEQIEAHRHEFPIFEHMVVMDPPARARTLPAQQAVDTAPAQGERRLHVAAGRYPARRVHRQRQV